ncbi:hypothetical protein ACH4TS_27005 [Streptomyces albidoflavus]
MEHPSMQVAAEEFGVRVASYGQLLEVRDDPSHTRARACVGPLIDSGRLDREGLHLVMPMVRNGVPQAGEEPSYRCYLWFLERGRDERTLALVDVSERRLKALARLDRRVLERVVLNLLGELPIGMLPGGGWAK